MLPNEASLFQLLGNDTIKHCSRVKQVLLALTVSIKATHTNNDIWLLVKYFYVMYTIIMLIGVCFS